MFCYVRRSSFNAIYFLQAALYAYNDAVIFATPHSETLALALANRSVVLAKLRLHTEAVVDITSSLGLKKYPLKNIFKLYQRRGMAYQALGQFHQASGSFEKAVQAVDKYSDHLSIKQKAKITQECKQMKFNNQKRIIGAEVTSTQAHHDESSKKIRGDDIHHKQLSKLIPNRHSMIDGCSGKID